MLKQLFSLGQSRHDNHGRTTLSWGRGGRSGLCEFRGREEDTVPGNGSAGHGGHLKMAIQFVPRQSARLLRWECALLSTCCDTWNNDLLWQDFMIVLSDIFKKTAFCSETWPKWSVFWKRVHFLLTRKVKTKGTKPLSQHQGACLPELTVSASQCPCLHSSWQAAIDFLQVVTKSNSCSLSEQLKIAKYSIRWVRESSSSYSTFKDQN